jgi:hypothetical protein
MAGNTTGAVMKNPASNSVIVPATSAVIVLQ